MAYIFYFSTLLKGVDDAQSFFGNVLSTKHSFAFYYFEHHMHTLSHEGLWWTEGSCNGEASLPGLPIKHETWGLSNLCSSAAYN